MKTRIFLLWIAAALAPFAVAAPAAGQPLTTSPAFEPNVGQAPDGTRFLTRALRYRLWLQEDGAVVYRLPSGATARMEMLGTNPRPPATGVDPMPSTTHIYAGPDASQWHPDIPHYGAVRYTEVYSGIDLFYRFLEGQLEYHFKVAALADPSRIQINFPDSQCSLGPEGGLVVRTANGIVRQHKPSAWQQIGGGKRQVAVEFELIGCNAGFRLGEYDHLHALVIDPLISSTYVGGDGWDAAYAVATDTAGNIYLTGDMASANFPKPSGTAGSVPPTREVWITKIAGSAIVYTAILSSGGNDVGRAIAVDQSGNAYVAGIAGGNSFPVTPGVVGATFGGMQDAFVARLDAAGHLVFATYLGGSGVDAAYGIALDPAGAIYVTGSTASPLFPTTTGAAQTRYSGAADAFVAKLNSSGTTLIYSTLLGGIGNDVANAIAVDSAGNAVIAGSSDSSNLPVHNAFQGTYGGSGDGFVGSLNASGTAWNYLTYLGGPGPDQAAAIAVDASGNAYVTGSTYTGAFASNPFQIGPRGGYDVFVTKLNPSGAAVFTTLFGGSSTDSGTAIAVDSSGRAWVGGYTMSPDFPQKNSWQVLEQGSFDGFLSWLSADGSTLLMSGFVGGGGDDRIWGIALGRSGPIVAGYTSSTNFPTTTGALQVTAPAGYNAFATQLSTVNPSKIGIFRNGYWQLDLSGTAQANPATMLTGNFGSAGNIPVVGDWDGSGRTKVGVYYNGRWLLDLSGTAQYSASTSLAGWFGGAPNDIPIVGNWDGAGKSKIGIFRDGTWIEDLTGTGWWTPYPAMTRIGWWGSPTDIPVTGDWDGSGRTKVGVFRHGQWILDLSGNAVWTPTTALIGNFGQDGDIPVVGDWDGTGKTKVGVFRNGTWYLDLTGQAQWNPARMITGTFGLPGDVPIVGDWDGSGKTKVGIFRNGHVELDLSGTASRNPTTALIGTFGQAGDIPVVGRW